MPKVRDMVAMDDDVIIADIDKEEILSVHNDSERIPNDSVSWWSKNFVFLFFIYRYMLIP